MLVVMTGVPGVGKSTVVKKAFERGQGKINYEMINYGDIMLGIAQERKLVSHRDEMRRLPVGRQREVQKDAAIKIRKMADERNIILDTHSTIETPKGYIPGMPEWVLRELRPECIVVLEAPPEDVNKFRKKDLHDDFRRREVDNLDGIRLHQDVNRIVALSYSVLTGTPIKIINKPDGHVDEAADMLLGVLA